MLTFDDPSEDEGEVFKVKSIYDLNDKGILPTTSKGRRKSKKKDEDGSNKALKLDKDSHIPSLASNSLSSAPTRKLGDNNDISNAGLDPQLESMIENPVNTNENLLNNTSQSTIKPAIQEEPHTRVNTDIDANSNANSNTNPSKKSSKVHPDDKHVKSSSISSELEKYKKKAQLPKKSSSDYQTKLFQKLSFFKSKLQSKDAAIGDSEPKRQTPTEHSACKLHGISNCGSCNKHVAVGEELPDTTGSNWMNHTLDFGASNPKKEKSSYAPKVEDYVVIDPREKEKLYFKNKTSKS
ncbi:Peptidyl-prolyl isomerase cwc27 [Zancudomyces culisetae]|uniref:Peptidyl-prolyl isomerase cwc27 n=1 Tax=Zancudomyces culisetae TaxID=1213189 RepID=A0A1R1PJI9_ZANCU|nr:Peptidyl-prolyl isomerase cwc27 [Zancudomyces culisetae]|eukprot:OMH81032.1 Peptidyl-prolyl isomerase cwc27 [Zancudomyces culisetae]